MTPSGTLLELHDGTGDGACAMVTARGFRAYREPFVRGARAIVTSEASASVDEAALPAYAHRSPLVQWLFWERVRTVMAHIVRKGPLRTAVDFGCGSGVLLPFLACVSERVLAADIDLSPLDKMRCFVDFAPNVETVRLTETSLAHYAGGTADVVLALDVLEHVTDLEGTIAELARMLAMRGELLVCGPTENFLYRLGRRSAGPRFTGDYHARSIYDIRRCLEMTMEVRRLRTLLPVAPLFEIYSATARLPR